LQNEIKFSLFLLNSRSDVTSEQCSVTNNPEGGEPDPAVHDRRRCNENSALSCIDKRTKEGCDRGSEDGTVIAGEARKRHL